MKILFRTIPLVALLSIGSSSLVYAVDDVAATKHNLSSTQTDKVNNLSTEATAFVCGFCHSPHTETGGPAPLWNRGSSAATYTMYSSATMDMTIAGAPASISLACLTCHDGTVGFDQLINGAGSGNYVAAGADQGWTFNLNGVPTTDTMPTGVTNLGNVLTGDHPISVTYDPTQDTAFQSVASVQAALQLYGAGSDQVECASCHNPHEATNPTFLRVGIDTLCTTCHIK
ncbi:MAG: cytochrome c3 family protein [Gammaproteobacteria bacterium]|nr:cytochrome c3 family protein [Gammaproteobacteria bacterium]MDH5388878.1 cytochrome c3 family protein [Gammaproteobacteria bacterium]